MNDVDKDKLLARALEVVKWAIAVEEGRDETKSAEDYLSFANEIRVVLGLEQRTMQQEIADAKEAKVSA